MTTVSQRSFSSGEISPSLYARTELNKYATGLRTCLNNIILRYGGAANRPGTEFICEVEESSEVSRIIKFIFNDAQTYVLEFGNEYLRIIKNGVLQTDSTTSATITGITKADPCVVTTSGAHGYSSNQEIKIEDVVGMEELNGRQFRITVLTGTTFSLQDKDASTTDIDSTNYTTYGSGGTSERVYEIATPYLASEVFGISYVQSGDVVSLVHPNHFPRELSRTSDTTWTLAESAFAPAVDFPLSVSSTKGGAGTETFRYKVTAVDEESGEESLPGTSPIVISGATQANPCVITATAHGLSNGAAIYISDVVGMTELNTNNYTIANVTANTFELSGIDSTAFTAYTSGGKVSRYMSGATQADPCVITATAHGFANDDEIYIEGVAGMTELNGRIFTIDNVAANTFELLGIDSTTYTTYTSGGVIKPIFTEEVSAATPTTAAPNVISWAKVSGALEYNVYKESNGIYGQIGIASNNTFNDIGIEANTSFTPPTTRNPFIGSGNYPSAVGYIQQRKAYANTTNNPEKIYLSRTGQFTNFTYSNPIQSDDAITFTMAGREVNEVKNLIDLNRFVALTSGGEWTINGDEAGAITPTSINPRQSSYNGSGSLRPIIVDGAAIYQQNRGSIIRDLSYNFESDGYQGNDLTIFSAHLFDKYTLVDWGYQQIPHSILWVVRSDGALLGLTFVRNQQVLAWHRHDLAGGLAESVSVVPEGNEDVVYITVKRTINGKTRRYIEKMSTRQITDIVDAKFMDAHKTVDGTNSTATTMTLSGGTDWTFDEDLTLTASTAFFQSTDISKAIHITDSAGDLVRCTISGYTSSTIVTVNPHKTVPATMRSTALTTWSYAIQTIVGLDHLEGKDVSVFADGFVVGSPNNSSYTTYTVTNGKVTLDRPYAVIHIGLPYLSDIETLDIDTNQGETIADKKKLIGEVILFTEETRGIWTGAASPTSASAPLDGLTELKIRETEDYDSPPSLTTDNVEITIRPEWNNNGRVFIRQVDPIPMTILSIHPAGKIPFRG